MVVCPRNSLLRLFKSLNLSLLVQENISNWKVYVCAQLCFRVLEGNAVKTWAVCNILLIISKGENYDIKILELSFS
jgi:hypothetical protein